MKKKWLIGLSICAILCTTTGCNDHFSAAVNTVSSVTTGTVKAKSSAKLMVNGTDISQGNYVAIDHENHYAELPLTAVLQAFGAQVEWQNSTTAAIILHGKEYKLDAIKGTMIESGGSANLLMLAPGSNHGTHYRMVGNEFVIDSDSVMFLIYNVMGANMRIDYEENIVTFFN